MYSEQDNTHTHTHTHTHTYPQARVVSEVAFTDGGGTYDNQILCSCFCQQKCVCVCVVCVSEIKKDKVCVFHLSRPHLRLFEQCVDHSSAWLPLQWIRFRLVCRSLSLSPAFGSPMFSFALPLSLCFSPSQFSFLLSIFHSVLSIWHFYSGPSHSFSVCVHIQPVLARACIFSTHTHTHTHTYIYHIPLLKCCIRCLRVNCVAERKQENEGARDIKRKSEVRETNREKEMEMEQMQ